MEPFCWIPTSTAKWLEEYEGDACGTRTVVHNRPIKTDGGVPLYTSPPAQAVTEAHNALDRLLTYGEAKDDPKGTLFRFDNGARFFLSDVDVRALKGAKP